MTPHPAPQESQIFISYAREDRVHADEIAGALRRQGWSVWWDPQIRLGTSYQSSIEAALDAALCVVVLWSVHSKASQWVKEEAESGKDRGILVPVLIEDVQPPLGFRLLQAAVLSGWSGNENHPEFRKLVEHIAALVGPGTPPERRPSVPPGDSGMASAFKPRATAAPRPHATAAERRPEAQRPVTTPTLHGTFGERRPDTSHRVTAPTSHDTSAGDSGGLWGMIGVAVILALVGLLAWGWGSLLGMVVTGLFAGLIAKLIMPGRDPGGIIVTIMLGVAGSLVGGLLFGGSGSRIGVTIGSVVGALILLFFYRLLVGRRRV
jgi:uncharacterized membrane protein YeaQ/YmgE (transglycosylase-associated protein family)